MRRISGITALIAVAIFIMCLAAYAGTYTVTQITNNDYDDWYPMIQGSQVVWQKPAVTYWEIFLWDGSTITQLSDKASELALRTGQITVNGQVVWSEFDGNDWEIFLWDTATKTKTQITNNDYDDGSTEDGVPMINRIGQVVWSGFDGNDWEIFLWDGATIINISDNDYDDNSPQTNRYGQVVWSGHDGSDYEIFLWDGSTKTQLTDNSYYDRAPQINNSGQVVWRGHVYGPRTPWEIFFATPDTSNTPPYAITQITHDSFDDGPPQIDRYGQVVWSVYDAPYYKIFLWDGVTITQLSGNSYDDIDPQLNRNGQMVWREYDGTFYKIWLWDGVTKIQLSDSWGIPFMGPIGQVVWRDHDGQIFLWDGTTITQFTDNSYFDRAPTINLSGQVAWMRFDGNDYEIFLATPYTNNTPEGDTVIVEPVDPNPVVGDGTEVTVTFATVNTGGETTVTSSGTGTPPPEGFKLGTPPVYYSIETTADYEPPIQICIDYSSIIYGNEDTLKLSHQTASGWEDTTDPGYPDTPNKIICGTVDSLSEFAILEADYEFVGFLSPLENPPVVNTANAGRTLPVKFQLIGDDGYFRSDLDAVTNIQYQETSCGGSLENPVYETDTSGSSGLRYDMDANQFIYTWKTEKEMAGKCYRLILELYTFDQYVVDFELK